MTDALDRNRPRLSALAYRMLGVRADAEDAVQETSIRWLAADRDAIANPQAWLTRVCTRLCIDMLRRRRAERDAYVGPWLPEPLAEEAADLPVLAESLRLAFLLMLERLTPAERAALLLHDVFEAGYDEIAEALGTSEAASRQHVSRARRHIAAERQRFQPAPKAEQALMGRFMAAVAEGDLVALTTCLAADARFVSDGGGKVTAALNIIEGRDKVARFFAKAGGKMNAAWQLRAARLNGAPALVGVVDGRAQAALTLATDGAAITAVFLIVNPDKLAGLTLH